MATERTIIKPINNVLYVEPNYIRSTDMYGANGLEVYEFTPDLEDYSIFVNLEVEVVGRTINAVNDKYVLSYVSSGDKEAVNLMQGSKLPMGDGNYINSLTTNYTDLHINNMRSVGASTELFGINYIDIAYRNYTVPEVTIEFTDVRGAAVFGQKELHESQEKAIDENKSVDIQNTFFQCFFTFPYPKFKLLVKGFYGQPVTYELTCADFRARFNSDTGNFSCTAKFVGYMFSFLNDVMMNGLVAAPFSDFIGAEYWSQKNFKLRAYDGGEINVPKIADLLKDLPAAINQADHIAKNSSEVQEKRFIENIKSKAADLKRLYQEYVRFIVELSKPPIVDGDLKLLITDGDNNVIENSAIVLIESDDNFVSGSLGEKEEFAKYFNDNDGKLSGWHESIVERIGEFNSDYSNRQLPQPDNMAKAQPFHRLYQNEKDKTKYIVDKSNYNKDIEEYPTLFNVFKQCADNENSKSGDKVSRYSKYQWGYFYKDNGFYSVLNTVIEEINNREREINKTLEESKKNALAEKLGFYPTVENLTRIVMAHFETFAYMIFKTGQLIESEDPKRTLKTLGIANGDDISDVKLSEKEKYIPPFPKFTEKIERDGMENREESWVGVYGNKFREVDLVHGILNGISEVAKRKNAGENSGGAGSESSLTAKMKCPLSPIDFIAEKNIYGTFSQNEAADILSLVGVRAIQILSSPNISGWEEHCDVLGRAEAENLLSTEKLSKALKESIKGKSADSVISMLKGNNADGLKPASGVWPWKNATGDTGIITNEGDFNICKVKTSGGNTVFTVPFQAFDWTKIKQEVFSSKSAHSDDYFNVAPSNYSDSKKNNVFNIETNINRIKDIAESQMVNIDGIDYYRDKILKEATYDASSYSGNMKSNASNFITSYISGAENLMPSKKSCMLPCTSNYVPNMELFAGGYDMDYFYKEHPGEGATAFFKLFGETWTDSVGNEVKRESANGFTEYLQAPTTTKYTIAEFPGLNSKFEPFTGMDGTNNLTSLFGQELYYLQESDYVKAFMFLCSLGGIYDYKTIIFRHICSKEKTISIIPLVSVLYAGGILWAKDNKDKFKYCNPFASSTNSYCEEILRNSLNESVKSSLRGKFEYFVKSGVKGNSMMKSFNSIRNNLELRLVRGDMDYEKFFKNLGEIEENGIFGKPVTWYKNGVFENRGYDNLLKFLDGELGDSLFKNYIAIDEDLGGNTDEKTVGFRLGNRDGSVGVVDAVNIALAPCTFMKNTKFFYKDSPAKINVNEGNLKTFFEAFLQRLSEGDDENTTSSDIAQSNKTQTSVEIKIGVYRYCKLLYDKWIGGTTESEFESRWTVHSLFDDKDKYFHFIDSFYNKIGQKILLNIGKFCEQIESCYKSDQYSLLSFLSSVYAENKFNLLCVQNFMDMQDLDNMKKMFDCVPYTSGWDIREHPNFIVQYPYEPSSHLDYGDDYTNDGFMINEPDNDYNKWPEALKSRIADSDNDYHIPAFGVSYGKMYQSYFTDIDVSMDNPKVTEQSIKAQFAIACLNNESESTNDRSNGYTIGQDLFSIYSNNSYTCNVTMMGCAWVQPLMYFVLNNVPMFRGTYMVISVSHRIEQGNMVTKFTGIRMANVNTRIAMDDMVRGEDGNNEGTEITDVNEETVHEESPACPDNDCEYPKYPVEPEDPSEADETPEEEPAPEPEPTPPTPPTPPAPQPAPKPKPKKETTPKIDNGGDYGEPNYSALLNGTVGQAKGVSWSKNKAGETCAAYWNSKNLYDSLVSVVLAESDKSDLSIQAMAAIIYNRLKAKDGKFTLVISNIQFSSWKEHAKSFGTSHPKWNYTKNVLKKIFTNGACSVMVGQKFVTPNWDLNRNKNNDLFYLKPNKEYTLTAPQVSNLFYNAFESEWYNKFNSKDNMTRHSDCKLVAVIGSKGPQVICLDPNFVKKNTVGGTIDLKNKKVTYSNGKKSESKPIASKSSGKIINNGDNHISSLGNSFLTALNKSSMSSGVNVEVGIDVNKSQGNVLYLQNQKDKNFGKILDIIIKTYNDKVSLVKWVVPGDGSNQSLPPRYLIVTLNTSNKSGVTKIKVVSEDNVDKLVSDLSISEEGGMNKDFCKAIIKKYGTDKKLINRDVDPDLTDEQIENLKKMFEKPDKKIQTCPAPSPTPANPNKSGSSGSKKTPTVNNTPNKPVNTSSWNVDAFAKNLNYWRGRVCEDRNKPRKKSGSCGLCTSAVNRALKSTLGNSKYWAKFPWQVYDKMKASDSEFNEIEKGTDSSKASPDFKVKTQIKKGDICLMWCSGNHNTDTTKNNYHSCGFDGQNWVSDFTQSSLNVYRSKPFTCTMEWHLFRHK